MTPSKRPGTARHKSKKYASLIAQLERQRGTRRLPKRVLIVCEDAKSARHYFEELRKHLCVDSNSLLIAPRSGGTQPHKVIERAIEIRGEAARDDTPFDQTWCVIDGDYGAQIPPARHTAQGQQIELAISNPCFEYWVLLHFEEWDRAALDCATMIRALKKHLPHYQKGQFAFSEIVEAFRDAARRAEKLRKPGLDRGDPPEKQNPCTEIYLLVNALLKLIDEGESPALND